MYHVILFLSVLAVALSVMVIRKLSRAESACEEAVDWLENAPFDYSNGNEYNGIDEGNVTGWKYHDVLVRKLNKTI